jgi:hypothetical protein
VRQVQVLRIAGVADDRLTAYALVGRAHGKCKTKVVPHAQETLLTASGPFQR